MNIENLIAYFLALKDNIILQRNDLLQQNRDISKKLLEITSKIDSLAKKNEELTSHVSVAQNASKILQEALKTASSKLVELERQHHKLEQYTRRECLDFSGIPNSVAPKHLENFILRLLQKISISFDKLRIVACHRLENTVRTIIKLLNWKDAENVYSNRKKLKDVDISCLVSDDDIQGRNDMTTGSQNDWREGGLSRKEKFLNHRISARTTDICMVCSKRRRQRVWFFYFWVFNGTICMTELQHSRVIIISNESDIWYFLVIFFTKLVCLVRLLFFIVDSWFAIFFFHKLLRPFLFPQITSVCFYVAKQ